MLAGFAGIVTALVEALAAFPHESVPDGAVLAPHHAYLGLFVVVLALWVVGDNYRDEPVGTAVGALALLTGFLFTWRWYPATGAGLSLAGVTVMLAATLWPGASTVARGWSLAGRVTDWVAGARTVVVARSATVAELWPSGEWSPYRLRWRAVAFVGAAVALDDVAEHALGVWTPLDAGWGQVYHLVP